MIDLNSLKQIYTFGKELSLSDIKILFKSAKKLSFEKRELLINEGTKENKMFFIIKGLVRCYFINDKGEEITFSLIPENYPVVNADMILYNQPSRFYYEALEPTVTYANNFNVVDELAAKYPKLEANRKHLFRRFMRESMNRVESFVLLSPEERYLQFIKDYPSLNNRVQDKYIANTLGMTPVSLSRIRKRIASKK
jgi:CRP-like cAMP-binding protein